MARPNSWGYSFTEDGKPGRGLLLHDNAYQEPSPEMKELAMGYPRGSTSAIGITTSMRHKILGACLYFNILSWIIGASLKLQNSTVHAAHLSSYNTQPTFDLIKFPDEWIVDGGATTHFTGHIADYINYTIIDHK